MSNSDEHYLDRNLFVTTRDKKRQCTKPYQADPDVPHGLAIDILPLDSFKNPKSARKKQFVGRDFRRRAQTIRKTWGD